MSLVTNNNSSLTASLLDNEPASTANSLAEKKMNDAVLSVVEQPAAQTPAVAAQPKRSFCKKAGDHLDKIAFGIFVAAMISLTQGFGLDNLL